MKLGLKLWSTNTDFYYDESKKLYNQGYFDYIELYVVPDTLDTISKWKDINIPFTLHAPHFAHHVNLADKDMLHYNKKIYEQVEIFRQELQAQFTIIHGGMNGTIEETIRQIKLIKPQNFLIENKPYTPPLCPQNISRGSTLEEISTIIQETSCGFCLDISHAICTANTLKLAPYTYIKEFEKFSPLMYHLCDGDVTSNLDRHLHLGHGNYNFTQIFSIINTDKCISIETQKNSKENLNDFVKDIEWFKQL